MYIACISLQTQRHLKSDSMWSHPLSPEFAQIRDGKTISRLLLSGVDVARWKDCACWVCQPNLSDNVNGTINNNQQWAEEATWWEISWRSILLGAIFSHWFLATNSSALWIMKDGACIKTWFKKNTISCWKGIDSTACKPLMLINWAVLINHMIHSSTNVYINFWHYVHQHPCSFTWFTLLRSATHPFI